MESLFEKYMSSDFDQFESGKYVTVKDFVFRPKRYEVWREGDKIKEGKINNKVKSIVRGEEEEYSTNVLIEIEDSEKIGHIVRKSVYDVCVTSVDRVQMLTIPAEKNSVECVGLASCRNGTGPTRRSKEFEKNEPYCCNLFLKDGNLSKVTFSINRPEKLVEFYS